MPTTSAGSAESRAPLHNGQVAGPSGPRAALGDPATQDFESESDDSFGDEPEESEGNPAIAAATTPPKPHPYDGLTDAELSRLLKDSPRTLGSASLGRTNAGALFNPVQMPHHAAWKLVDPSHAWATAETVDYLSRALLEVVRRYPDTEPVSIGHLSAERGGPLRPHVSHQSGRDVDLGFYYLSDRNAWYKRATVDNLDLPRTWCLVQTLVAETDIEMILLDQNLIDTLEHYARSSGEDPGSLRRIFHDDNGRGPIVRHATGHATHLHLRFRNPIAQESGRRLMPMLVERRIVAPPQRLVNHVARGGETLAKLAARYSTTMQAIRQANAMKTYQLVAGATYRIPVDSDATPPLATAVSSRRRHHSNPQSRK